MVKSKNRKFNTYGFVFTSCRWYNDWCYNFKDIIVPSGNVITLTDAPVSGTSAANKSYVDSQIIVNATPNATSQF